MGTSWLSPLGSCKFLDSGSSFQPGSFYCGHLCVEQCCVLYIKTLWLLTYWIISLVHFLFWSAWKLVLGPLLPHMFLYFCCTEGLTMLLDFFFFSFLVLWIWYRVRVCPSLFLVFHYFFFHWSRIWSDLCPIFCALYIDYLAIKNLRSLEAYWPPNLWYIPIIYDIHILHHL